MGALSLKAIIQISDMIKVLWFTNVDVDLGDLEKGLNSDKRGWMSTLAAEIMEETELHVASMSVKKKKSFLQGNLLYNHYLTPKFARTKLFLRILLGYKSVNNNILPQMLKLVEEIQPDLVHIHGSENEYIRIIPELNKMNIPALVSLQGIVSVISKKFTAGYSKLYVFTHFFNRGFKRTAILPQTLFLQWYQFKKQAKLEEEIFKEVPFFAGRTFWDRSIVGVLNPKAMYFHIDRVLKPIFYQKVWNTKRNEEVYIIHTTTSNSIYKGFEIIAESAYLLENSGLSFEWRIAGIKEDSWSVIHARKKLGLRFPKKSLVFLGKLNALDLANRMIESDQYVSSSHIENSPNNLAEAMMLGMPCIATDVGGTSTYLQNNLNGILVPSGDPHALAGSIFSLSLDLERRKRLGMNARQISLDRHNKAKIKSAIINTYNTIIDKRLEKQ